MVDTYKHSWHKDEWDAFGWKFMDKLGLAWSGWASSLQLKYNEDREWWDFMHVVAAVHSPQLFGPVKFGMHGPRINHYGIIVSPFIVEWQRWIMKPDDFLVLADLLAEEQQGEKGPGVH